MIEESIYNSETIIEMFVQRAYSTPDAVAYEDRLPDGSWKSVSFSVYGEQVEHAALGLRELGIEAGECVAIFGDTMPEWSIFSLATQAVGAHVAGIYQTSTAEQAVYILQDSGAKVVCLDRMERLTDLLKLRDQIPHVTKFIVWGPDVPDDDAAVSSIETIYELGRAHAEAHTGAFEEMAAKVSPDDYAVLVYTSGTTGSPKGVILTHGNCMSNAKCIFDKKLYIEGDSMVAFLPMSHVAEYMSFLGRILGGMTAFFCPDFKMIGEIVREKRPSLLVGVPRVYEKVQQRILAAVQEKPPRQRQMFEWAVGIGRQVTEYKEKGKGTPAGLAIKHRFADRLVLSKVRQQLGGNLRAMFTAAAPIDAETIRFFYSIGIPLLEAYGLSESSGASHMNLPDNFRIGSVGQPIDGMECVIAEDGEVLMRGPSIFTGYLNKAEATAEMLDDEGWLHTGDIGEIDEQGFLCITDRKKNLIITAGGKNVAPSNSELLIKREALVSQAVVLGDRKPFLVALLTVSPDIEATPDEIQSRFQAAVDFANSQLAPYEQIKKFRAIDREFTIESGEMTPTMKIKRNVVMQNFADLVDEMYKDTAAAGI